MRIVRWLALVPFLAIVLSLPNFSRAAAVLLTQTRRVEAQVRAISEQTFTKTAPDFGDFDETAVGSLEEHQDIDGFDNVIFGSASATQTSSVTPSLLVLSADLHADSSDSVGGSRRNDAITEFDVTFSLDRPHFFHLAFSFFELNINQSQDLDQQFAFTRTDDNTDLLPDLDTTPGGPVAQEKDGVLPVGTYHFSFLVDLHTAFDPVDYTNISARLEMNPTPSAAVPLPPALWSGLVGLIAVAFIRRARHACCHTRT
jgi:hypothetical protein